MTDQSLFRFMHPVEVRFADLDAMEHVNNAKYFTYMETARLLYFNQVVGWTGSRSQLSVILARAACDFKLPLVMGDQAQVYVRVMRLGSKSFDFEYLIVRAGDQALAAVGSSVQVAYDYETGVSIPIPADWRTRITAYEPALKNV